MDGSVQFRGVSVVLGGGVRALDDVSLAIEPGEAVAFVGRSGAGKTTALRLINGLVQPTSGTLLLDGSSPARATWPVLRRSIGYVIQGSGLFPHRTTFENIAAVPRLLEWDDARTRTAVERVMEQVQLPPKTYASRYPRTLSGGEQQRVGIARAIVFSPAVLLCDEPFGALDPIVRRELQDIFLEIRQTIQSMLVFVTHDLSEALRMSGRIVHFERGRVITDVPADRYLEHSDPIVQRFVSASRFPERREV